MSKHKDKIPGGMADKRQPKDFDPKALAQGVKVELEHTNDKAVAQEIAMDHLSEDPEYYKKLATIHKSVIDKLSKGRKALPIGTLKTWSGVEYVKTSDGWKPTSKQSQAKEESPDDSDSASPSPKAPPKDEAKNTLRSEANAEVTETKDDYLNARQSKISNIGEDVKGAARHKRLSSVKELRGLSGSLKAKELVEGNPLDVLSVVNEDNFINPYLAYKIINRFPNLKSSEPSDREFYLDTFEYVKQTVESDASNPDIAPRDLLKKLRTELVAKLKQARADKNNPSIGNDLVNYINNTLSLTLKRGSVIQDLEDLAQAFKRDLPSDTERSTTQVYAAMTTKDGLERIRQMVEGKSLTSVFGSEKDAANKKKKLSLAEYYVESKVERKGPELKEKTLESQQNFITEKCKIRAVQWGNSVTDSEREHHLKNTTQSLSDLSSILGLPEELVSFNGRLALAIGARGQGTAMATYNPSDMIINLTRAKGVGSLAHEWGHFLDNILAKLHNVKAAESNNYLSEASYFILSTDPSDLQASMKALVTSEAYKEFYKQTKDSLIEFTNKGFAVGPSSYWLSPREMFARAFETYVDYKLVKANRKNTYLTAGNRGVFWPTEELMTKLAPLFDDFINKFKDSEYLNKSLEFFSLLQKGRKALPVGTTRTWGGVDYVKTKDGQWMPKGKPKGKEENSTLESKDTPTIEQEEAKITPKNLHLDTILGKPPTKEGSKTKDINQLIRGSRGSNGDPSSRSYLSPKSSNCNLVGYVAFGKASVKVQEELNEHLRQAEVVLSELGIKFKTPIDFVCQKVLSANQGTLAEFIRYESVSPRINIKARNEFSSVSKSLMHEIGHALDHAMGDTATGFSSDDSDLKKSVDKLRELLEATKFYSQNNSPEYKNYLSSSPEVFARAFEVYAYSKGIKLVKEGKLSESFISNYKPDMFLQQNEQLSVIQEEIKKTYAELKTQDKKSLTALELANRILSLKKDLDKISSSNPTETISKQEQNALTKKITTILDSWLANNKIKKAIEMSNVFSLIDKLSKSWATTTRGGERYYVDGPYAGKKVGSVRGQGEAQNPTSSSKTPKAEPSTAQDKLQGHLTALKNGATMPNVKLSSGKPLVLDAKQAIAQGYTVKDFSEAVDVHYEAATHIQEMLDKLELVGKKVPKEAVDIMNFHFKKMKEAMSSRDYLQERQQKTEAEVNKKKTKAVESVKKAITQMGGALGDRDIDLASASMIRTNVDKNLLEYLQNNMHTAEFGGLPKQIMLDKGDLYLALVDEGLYSGHFVVQSKEGLSDVSKVRMERMTLPELCEFILAKEWQAASRQSAPIAEDPKPELVAQTIESLKKEDNTSPAVEILTDKQRILETLSRLAAKLL